MLGRGVYECAGGEVNAIQMSNALAPGQRLSHSGAAVMAPADDVEFFSLAPYFSPAAGDRIIDA